MDSEMENYLLILKELSILYDVIIIKVCKVLQGRRKWGGGGEARGACLPIIFKTFTRIKVF